MAFHRGGCLPALALSAVYVIIRCMIRILHVADVHLGASFSSFGSLAGERAERLLGAFRDLPRMAQERDVHMVVFAGDLFDSARPDGRIAAEAVETIRRLLEFVPAVFLVPGNHDPLVSAGSPYAELPAGAHVFTAPEFTDPVSVDTRAGPVHAYGLAYDFSHARQPLGSFKRSDLPGAHVVILHAAVRDAPHWSGGESLRVGPADLSGLDADYIALGDYHRFRPPAEFAADHSIRACYCGSFAALDHTESGPHGVVIAEIEPLRTARVTLIPSDVPSVQSLPGVDISTCEDDREAVERVVGLVEPGALPVVTLTGQTEYAVDPARIEADLAARYSYARVVDRTRYYDSDRLAGLAARDDVVGHLARIGLGRVRTASDEEDARTRERALRKALRAMGVS